MSRRERRAYRFQTGTPEAVLDDLRDRGLRLAGVSVAAGDAYGVYVVELVASGTAALLDSAEEAWSLEPVVA